ncbi:MAG: coproporphyrinogen dehydrogenase HemZ [Lachnospiraceae bacterium]|nr:coproporphyrinogen dehydrogenase HemZ [Lachnospiraceae bacterium]
MIYLYQNEELYNNDIRVMLQAFFDNEKVVTEEEDTRLGLKAVFTYDTDVEVPSMQRGGYVTFTLEDEFGYVDEKTVVIDFMDKKIARNPIKGALYKMLSAYTKKELPWGSLTGVRPTKIATECIEQGKSEEEIHKLYTDVYLATSQKADICIEVAKNEQKLFADYDYENEYCVYIGIPFCPSRCLYCSFTSYPIALYADEKKTGFTVKDYLNALCKEISFVASSDIYSNKRLVAIYIGGGTPSALTAEQLRELITHVKSTFDMSYVREFCVECGRPDSITEDKLTVLKECGVGRISINPQTMSDETLKLIGRAHTVSQTKDAYALARQVGFDNINMDMIVGLPGEDIEHVRHTLSEIEQMAPDSLTVHSLAIKRAANLNIEMENYRSLIKGSTNEMLMAVDECARRLDLVPYYLYRQKNIPGKLENIGYAIRGKECAYNVLIMEEKMDILAMGAGASSKFVFRKEGRIERVENVKNVEQYIARIDEMIGRKQQMFEIIKEM